ncbi:pyruvate kinase, partial [Mycobacterium sp. ITM-2017-0098]
LVTAAKTTYVTTGMSMRVLGEHDEVDLGLLPETTQSLVLHAGASGVPGIGCTLPEVFDNASPGDEIFFDDGKIGGVVVAVAP